MKITYQFELDYPEMTPSKNTEQALSILEISHADKIHSTHQERVLNLANKIAKNNLKSGEAITSPKDSSRMIQNILQSRTEECVGVLFLNNNHQVIQFEELFH